MKKQNNKLLNKIGYNMLLQYPPQSLYKMQNKWEKECNEAQNKNFKCILHNNNCSGNAINSHSIPKKNLKMMSENNKVFMLKYDFNNPFKRCLSLSDIKSTLTFYGFCKYHDNALFQRIENKDVPDYDENDIFFINYRTLAKEYRDKHICIDKKIYEINNWNSNNKKELDKEIASFNSNPYINFGKTRMQLKWKWVCEYLKCRVNNRHFIRSQIKILRNEERIIKRKLESFNKAIINKKIIRFHSVILENENQIAFTGVFICQQKDKNVLLYAASIPQKDHSLLILSCGIKDFECIKGHKEINRLFSGDEDIVNEFLNLFKDKIVMSAKRSGNVKSDQYFLEWDLPLVTIPFFKKIDNIDTKDEI